MVHVLGRCEADGVTLRFRQAELVGLLAVRPEGVARATAAATLWPEAELRTARHNLRQTLVALRAGGADPIHCEGETLRLGGPVDLWELETLLRGETPPEALRAGELLPGVQSEWVFPERERFARERVASALRQGEKYLSSNALLALAYADAAIEADPYLEAPRALRMRALLAMGERLRAENEIETFERAAGLRSPSRLRALLATDAGGPFAGQAMGPLSPHECVRLLTCAAPGLGRAARPLLTRALESAPRLSEDDRAAAETALAHLALDDGDVTTAEARATAAIGRSRHGVRHAAAAHALARVFARTDRSDEAVSRLDEAERESEEDRELRGWIEASRGAVLARSHALPEAERHLRAALALAGEVGSVRLALRSRYNLAAVAIWAGRPDAAVREAEAGLRDAGHEFPQERAPLEMILGRVQESQGRWTDAHATYANAVATLRLGGDPWHLAQAITNAADLDRRRGAFDQATAAYGEAIGLRRGLGDRIGLATALKGLGQALASQGDAAGAEEALRESLAAYLASGEPLGGAAALVPLARLLRKAGRREEALTLARRAVERLGRMRPDPGGLATDDTLSIDAARSLVAELESGPLDLPGFGSSRQI